MYDPFTSRYAFACPSRGETHVLLSAFRSIEQLPGVAHPAVFRVRFECGCGEEHDGLLTHEELDWGAARPACRRVPRPHDRRVSTAPTASWASSRPRTSDEGSGRGASSATPEGQPRPVFPSSFALLAATGGPVGLAVRCPSCHRLSLNLVSRPHIDVPFHNDREIGVVEHMFAEDALATLAEFRAELWSSSFDARRLALE